MAELYMNHINHHESNNNIPAWKVLQERRQDPFHFMISRPQPPGSTTPPLPEVDLARKNSRVVIPSKRAAQNRAAQKAFRQRRDQYIKELETKANEVKETQLELNQLRQENSQLRERVSELERQIVALTGGQEKQEQSLSIPTITSEQETTPKDLSTGFQNDENEPLANNHTIAVQNYPQFAPPMVNIGFWQGGHHNTVDFEFAFDPFLDNEFGLTNNEFVPSEDNEQVLDDLFAVLQTRQRPQIPTVPSSLDELDNN